MRPPLAPLLLVVAASAVIAATATGVSLLLPPASLSDGWILTVRIAGAVALAAGLAGLLVQRRHLKSSDDKRYDPTAAALAAAATIMIVLAAVARLAPMEGAVTDTTRTLPDSVPFDEGLRAETGRRSSSGFIRGGVGGVREGRDRRMLQPIEVQAEDGWIDASTMQRLRLILLLALLLAAAAVTLWMLRGRMTSGRGGLPLSRPIEPAEAEAGLEASLGEVAYEGADPRRQITAAYHRLLAALSAAGAPRLVHEAPHEHLHRTLAPLGIHPEPMHRLAELYVVAQFTEHPVEDHHRITAAEALETALASLRASIAEKVEA